MAWTTPSDIRTQVQKLWDKGLLLSGMVSGEECFPRRLSLKGPGSSELSSDFAAAQAWVAALHAGAGHYRVVSRQVRHRVLGANAIPVEIWVDTRDHAIALIGKRAEAERFLEIIELTRQPFPEILPWLARYPHRALALHQEWPRLLQVVEWVRAHPRPAVYLRQVDLPGVHTKFIEAHQGVLAQLLDIVLPPENIDAQVRGADAFCARFGFRSKPLRTRFRILDPALAIFPGVGDQDITLAAEVFADLTVRVRRVFITENEINFLAFPLVPESMVLFGAGYGFEMWANAEWLHHCDLHYWGDIDTHGFNMLDQLRARYPQTRSFLMTRQVLLAHQELWGTEPDQVLRDMQRLTEEERALYDDLRYQRLGTNVRLEQERVGIKTVQMSLDWLTNPG